MAEASSAKIMPAIPPPITRKSLSVEVPFFMLSAGMEHDGIGRVTCLRPARDLCSGLVISGGSAPALQLNPTLFERARNSQPISQTPPSMSAHAMTADRSPAADRDRKRLRMPAAVIELRHLRACLTVEVSRHRSAKGVQFNRRRFRRDVYGSQRPDIP